MTIYPAGTQISGVAMRLADQTEIRIGGKRYTEVISGCSLPDRLPSGVPLTLGHGDEVGDRSNGDGHRVGTVDFYRSGLEVRFYGQLTEPVELDDDQGVSAGWQMLRDDVIVIESRSRGRDYRVPVNVEFRHLALVANPAYPNARIHKIGEEVETEVRAAAYMREWDEVEERVHSGQMQVEWRPCQIVSVTGLASVDY